MHINGLLIAVFIEIFILSSVRQDLFDTTESPRIHDIIKIRVLRKRFKKEIMNKMNPKTRRVLFLICILTSCLILNAFYNSYWAKEQTVSWLQYDKRSFWLLPNIKNAELSEQIGSNLHESCIITIHQTKCTSRHGEPLGTFLPYGMAHTNCRL